MGLVLEMLHSLVYFCSLFFGFSFVEVFQDAVHTDTIELQLLMEPPNFILAIGKFLFQ